LVELYVDLKRYRGSIIKLDKKRGEPVLEELPRLPSGFVRLLLM